jgi:hypothetical protein
VANQPFAALVTGVQYLDGDIAVRSSPGPVSPEQGPHLIRAAFDFYRVVMFLHGPSH